jgi:hypothetical protein
MDSAASPAVPLRSHKTRQLLAAVPVARYDCLLPWMNGTRLARY